MSRGGWLAPVGPGAQFVIAGAVAEAAMQDADQPIAQGAQSLMVGGASGALLVVVGTGARRAGKRAEGPQVAGVGEALVAGHAGQYNLAGARGAGDGGGARIGLAGLRVGGAGRGVPELRQHPGAGDQGG